jgi:hypothetical protein
VYSRKRVLDAMQMTVSDLEVSSVVVLEENWNLLSEISATHTGVGWREGCLLVITQFAYIIHH